MECLLQLVTFVRRTLLAHRKIQLALALAHTCFGFFVLPESLPPERRRAFQWARANPLGTLLALRKYPVVLGLAAATLLWSLAHQVLPSTWSFYTMQSFGWSEAAVGYSLAAAGIVMAISQAGLTRILIPRLGGEGRAALVGMIGGVLVYCCYAFATQGWMMYAGIAGWSLAAMTWPSMNALMSQQIPPNAQGELQGAVASIMSLTAILAPPFMTQLFGRFTADDAPIYFPGAPFLAAAILAAISAAILTRVMLAPKAVAVTSS